MRRQSRVSTRQIIHHQIHSRLPHLLTMAEPNWQYEQGDFVPQGDVYDLGYLGYPEQPSFVMGPPLDELQISWHQQHGHHAHGHGHAHGQAVEPSSSKAVKGSSSSRKHDRSNRDGHKTGGRNGGGGGAGSSGGGHSGKPSSESYQLWTCVSSSSWSRR